MAVETFLFVCFFFKIKKIRLELTPSWTRIVLNPVVSPIFFTKAFAENEYPRVCHDFLKHLQKSWAHLTEATAPHSALSIFNGRTCSELSMVGLTFARLVGTPARGNGAACCLYTKDCELMDF